MKSTLIGFFQRISIPLIISGALTVIFLMSVYAVEVFGSETGDNGQILLTEEVFKPDQFQTSDSDFDDIRVLTAGNEVPDYIYIKNENSVAITQYIGTEEEIIIPREIEGLKVTSVSGTFRNNKNIKKVTIPDGVETIGDYTFEGCLNLKEVNIPDGCRRLGTNSFEGTAIEEINVPDSVSFEDIGSAVFADSNLKRVNLPSNIKIIPGSMFWGCRSLETITIPKGVETISYGAFNYCSGLKSIELPSTVKTIGWTAFSNCTSLSKLVAGENVTNIESSPFGKCPNLTIWCPEGSYIYKYAQSNNIRVHPTDTSEPTEFKVLPDSVNVSVDEVFTIATYVVPEDAKKGEVDWISSDPKVVSVDENGRITGKTVGEATITASIYNGRFTATCEVVVTPVFISNITINLKDISLGVDDEQSIPIIISPENATKKEVMWESRNPLVATVDDSGKIRGISVGKTTIIVSSTDGSNVNTSCEVIVTPRLVKEITFSHTKIFLEPEQSKKLVATIIPENAENKQIEWASYDPRIASVDNLGNVTAITEGETIIKASAIDGSGKSAQCRVNVVKEIIEVSNISLNASTKRIVADDYITLVPTIFPENATDKTITWTSTNNAVATVSADGIVMGKSIGTVIIKATTSNGKSASCTVTVTGSVNDIHIVGNQKIDIKSVCFPNETRSISRYIVDNKSVASVSSGSLVGKKAGKVTVSAQVKNDRQYTTIATCEVEVLSRPKLKFSKPFTIIGQTMDASQCFTTTDTRVDDITLWESSKSDVVEVIDSQNGIIEAKGNGTAKITAYFGKKGEKGTVKVSSSVSVKVPAFKKVDYSIKTGEKYTLSMKNVTAAMNPSWMIDDMSVATVSPQYNRKGELTGKAVVEGIVYGNTTLTATIDNVDYTCKISVIAPQINKKSVRIKKGRTSKVYLKNTKIKKSEITWTTLDPNIATVDANGTIKGINTGITTVYTDCGGIRNECTVTVE